MSNINDFVIEDGVLTGYNGNDTDVVIPDGVTKIDGYVFSSNDSLKSVIIPDSVTEIGFSAFEYCGSLTTVKLGKSLKTISDSAFYECSSLESITIPSSITAIGSFAFYGCSALKTAFFENPNDWKVYTDQFDDNMEMYFSEWKNRVTSEELADPIKAAECLSNRNTGYWCCNDTSYLDFIKSL